jgi:uncharacterized protein
MSLSRRHALGLAAATVAFGGLSRALAEGPEFRNEAAGYGPLVPDPAGVFDLPAGFSYRIVSKAGEPMDDGLVTPGKMDGMACFPGEGHQVILVRNHELRLDDHGRSAWGADRALASKVGADRAYDRSAAGVPHCGGTTTVVWDVRQGRRVTQHLSLAGTMINCAGGATPRRTWLSCEETEIARGPESAKDHGYVFEVPADLRGLADPVPITGMGRFKHEANATDPRTGIVYQTEDQADGLFTRYLPNDPKKLQAGGRLQALGFPGGAADTRNWDSQFWKVGERRKVVWIDLDGVDSPAGDLRHRGRAKGAATFARGEGVVWGDREFFFTCTSGGKSRNGQILRYRPSPQEGRPGERDRPGELQLFVEPGDAALMSMADNIAVAPSGHLFICEDKYAGRNALKGVTPTGRLYTFGCNAAQPVGKSPNAELAGVCFSPDGSTMFVNVYSPGITLAIIGPWGRVKA